MNRQQAFEHIAERARWDLAVIGGGATGLGIAVDAASRGYSVVLLEGADFGKGTSSRSTKLIHGGVRYLRQGNVSLVRESLRERSLLLRNAPHLVSNCEFLVPNYAWWEAPYYGIGLKLYGLLAGSHGFGPSKVLSREESLHRVPTLVQRGLRGGITYHDGQFDDTRLLVTLARTAVAHGACVINYAAVTALHADTTGSLNALTMRDELSGAERRIEARCIINATGPFSDAVRRMDDPHQAPIIAPSQGVHLVLPRRFVPGSTAVMVPRTSDGRVMFAIPWHGHTVVGTTDTPISHAVAEPRPLASEVAYLLDTAAHFLEQPPGEDDILSVFTGIRPLVKSKEQKSSAISREHLIQVSQSGLLTVAGGKWTTYRQMAEDAVNAAAKVAGLPQRPCKTRELRLHGWHASAGQFGDLAAYGAEVPALRELEIEHPEWAMPLHPDLPITGVQIAWAVRHEMAQTLEDVLARRSRALFLNVRAALQIAPVAVDILARELGRDAAWAENQLAEFRTVAESYLSPSGATATAG